MAADVCVPRSMVICAAPPEGSLGSACLLGACLCHYLGCDMRSSIRALYIAMYYLSLWDGLCLVKTPDRSGIHCAAPRGYVVRLSGSGRGVSVRELLSVAQVRRYQSLQQLLKTH